MVYRFILMIIAIDSVVADRANRFIREMIAVAALIGKEPFKLMLG